jgi:xylulokinase
MTKPSILVIDVGTTVAKISLFDFTCRPVGCFSRPHAAVGMEVAAVAESLWNLLTESVPALLRSNPGWRVAGVGLTGFMHEVIPLDRRGAVPSLTSAASAVRSCFDAMVRDIGVERIFETTGSRLDVTSVPPQLLAWRKVHPSEFGQVSTVLPVKDFVRYRLTGQLATDEIDACGTMLFDVYRRRWDPELATYCGLKFDVLPPVLRGTDRAGEITREAAEALGIPEGTPVAVGGGDDIELIGSGARTPEQVCEHVGSTGSFLMPALTPRTDPTHRLELYPAAVRNEWVLGGSCSNVSRALDWFLASSVYARDGTIAWETLGAELAASLATLHFDRPFFLPYVFGERAPLWNPDLSAQWRGLRSSHCPSDLLISAVEGICFSLRNILEAYKDMGLKIDMIYSSGGFNRLGAQRLRASVYGKAIRRVRGVDPTSFAASAITLCSLGQLHEPSDATEWLEFEPDIEPKPAWQSPLEDRFNRFLEYTKDAESHEGKAC